MRTIEDNTTLPSELTLEIEKLSNLGFGIARKDRCIIFVEDSCPGDILKVKVTKRHKNYANAVISEIIKPSSHRCEPICAMQKVCGACQLQFIEYGFQLEQKKEIVLDAFHGMGIEVKNVIPSPKITGYRMKIQYPVSETKNSKRILAGYYKTNSHEIVNIKHCPIQPQYCDEIVEFIRGEAQALKIGGYREKEHTGDLKHIVIRASEYSGKYLVILVVNSSKIPDKIKKLASKIYTELENIAGVGVNFNSKKTNLILGKTTVINEGDSYIEEKLCDKVFKIGADTFFQINPLSANNMFEYVKKYISDHYKSPVILDAYAGIAAFGISLSDIAKKVVCVEEITSSVKLAASIIKENNIDNIELHNSDAAEFFETEFRNNGKSFDIIVVDPPRKGCTIESLDYALKLTKDKIIYVSCNPSTLARDLKYLTENGCVVEYVQPFDMFPHTYHIECVAIINVKKEMT